MRALSALVATVVHRWRDLAAAAAALKRRAATVHAAWRRRVRAATFRHWFFRLVEEREANLCAAVAVLRRQHVQRIALRNMFNGCRAAHHRREGLKIAAVAVWRKFARGRRFARRTARFVDHRRAEPLLRAAVRALRAHARAQRRAAERRRLAAAAAALYLGRVRRAAALARWLRATRAALRVQDKVCPLFCVPFKSSCNALSPLSLTSLSLLSLSAR
jgi:hypothetical protein